MPSFTSDVNNRGARGLTARELRVTIARMKECPLCGETMRLEVREIREAIPGSEAAVRTRREWICPECDYFEEAEAGED